MKDAVFLLKTLIKKGIGEMMAKKRLEREDPNHCTNTSPSVVKQRTTMDLEGHLNTNNSPAGIPRLSMNKGASVTNRATKRNTNSDLTFTQED